MAPKVRGSLAASSALNLTRCTLETSRIVPGRWFTRYGLAPAVARLLASESMSSQGGLYDHSTVQSSPAVVASLSFRAASATGLSATRSAPSCSRRTTGPDSQPLCGGSAGALDRPGALGALGRWIGLGGGELLCGAKKLKGEEKRDGIAALCAAGGPPARECKQLAPTCSANSTPQGVPLFEEPEIRKGGSKPGHRRSK